MTMANEHGADDAAYRAGAAALTHTDSQERLERAKAGLAIGSEKKAPSGSNACIESEKTRVLSFPEAEAFDPSQSSFDPRQEKARPNFERTTYKPKACSFNQILELWAAHEGGVLTRIGNHDPSRSGDGYGEDEAMGAWDWVSQTPGWGPVVHEVMRHLVLRNRTWEQWPVAAAVYALRVDGGHLKQVKVGKKTKDVFVPEEPEYRSYCDWPFITKDAAGAAWVPFYRALRKRYRLEPYCVKAQTVEFA